MAQVIPRRGGWYSDFRYKGKRYQRFLAKDKRLAHVEFGKLIERVKGESNTGELPWATFKELLFTAQGPHTRENTKKRDRAALSIYEQKFFPRYLTDLTPKTLRELITLRLSAGVKPSSVKREVGSLKAKMRWAEVEGLRKPEDWRSVKLPKVPKKRPHAHSREDLSALIRHCKGTWKTVAWLGGRAGLRRGEIRSLEWADVDFEHRYIRVRAKKDWQPKDSDERDILLLDDLADYLRTLKRTGRRVLGDDPPSLAGMSIYFKRLTKQAGLTGNIHTLRHSYISILANDDNVNIHALKDWAGHSSIATTEGYRHPATSHKAEASKITRLDA